MGSPEYRIGWVLETSEKMTRDLFDELSRCWNKMYEITPEIASQRCEKFIGHLEDFYADILLSEHGKEKSLRIQIDEKVAEIKKLEKELDVKIEYTIPKEVPMVKVINQLNSAMENYVEVRASRIKTLKNLRAQEKTLCEQLEMPLSDPVPEVPSVQQLENIELHVFTLQEEKVKRIQKYISVKNRVKEILEDMEKDPETDFAIEVLSSSEDTFKFSGENVGRLEEFLNSLEESYLQVLEEREFLISQLKNLWRKINYPLCDSQQFLDTHHGIKSHVIKEIKEEIERCHAIKLANIKEVIHVAKRDLEHMWDKLTYTEEQRKDFLPYYSDHFSEDILELLEHEISTLNKYYEDNIDIYELANKRDSLWKKMIRLDELAQDKTRLFNNRGGQLLKEEKERKSIEINLPKIDNKLQQLLADYYSRYNKPFLWHGHNLQTKIVQDWDEHNTNKELKKLQRKAEHTKEVQIEAILGTKTATKRKMPVTPKFNTVGISKIKKMDNCQNANGGGTDGLTAMINTTITKGSSKERPVTPVSPASVTSYSYFKDEIEETAMSHKKILAETPGSRSRRAALRELNCGGSVMCSSPTDSPPLGQTTPKARRYVGGARTPGPRLHTPRRPTPARPRTPATSPRFRKHSPPRLTPARSRFNLDI